MNLFLHGDTIVDRLSKTKHLRLITFIIAFLEATISPILPEAFLLIVLAYRKDISWKVLSVISALGSSFGALAMYWVGATFYETYGKAVLVYLNGEAVAEKARILFEQNVFMAQFIAAFTPLPDRVFSFLAGAFVVSPVLFFLATFSGRLIRISIVAYLSYEYGDEAREYIKRHTRSVMICFCVIVVLYALYTYFK